jgi:hypothetical protein
MQKVIMGSSVIVLDGIADPEILEAMACNEALSLFLRISETLSELLLMLLR